MTITTTATQMSLYTGNGSTDTYAYTFPIIEYSELVVIKIDTNDVQTTLVLDTDYTATGARSPTGGNVVLTVDLPLNYRLRIKRVVPVTQLTDLKNQGRFYPETHEDVFDHLTKIAQQQQTSVDDSLRLEPVLREYYDADSLPIRNLPNASEDTEAVPLGQMNDAIAGIAGVGFTVAVTQFDANANDGVTNATVAIQAAIDSLPDGGTVYFPPGTYIVTPGEVSTTYNVSFLGAGASASVLKYSRAAAAGEFILEYFGDNTQISGLGFNGGGFTSASRPNYLIGVGTTSSGLNIHHCAFTNYDSLGILANGADLFSICDNYFKLIAPDTIGSQAITVSSSGGAVDSVRICRNVCENTAILADIRNSIISDNIIFNYNFGGGISMGQTATCYNNVISGNVIYDGGATGAGIDSNAATQCGIENWGANTSIIGNVCYNNSGSGIEQGGKNCTVSGNTCYDNGTYSGFGAAGINSRYADATYSASGSTVTGNRCYDSAGAGGTQTYGYTDQSSSVSNITFSGNNFAGNKTGEYSLLGTGHRFPNSVTAAVSVASASGVLTLDWSATSMYRITLTENITSVVFTNMPAVGLAGALTIQITQHASSPKTITGWPATVKWFGGTYVATASNGALDEVALSVYVNAGNVYGKYSQAAA